MFSNRFLSFVILFSFNAYSANLERFYISNFTYEDYLYSTSKKTEIGDSAEIELDVQYNFSQQTNFSFGLQTFPEDNRFNNKTSKIELLVNHQLDELKLSLDGEIQTNESSTGGTTIGFDLDSEKTNISYGANQTVITFYPFNFDGEVGDEFNTWDITRIYYIDGSPTTVGATAGTDDKIASKTIPGISLSKQYEKVKLTVGIGQTSYLYPANPDFDLVLNPSATRWEKKEAIAYRFGVLSKIDSFKLDFKFVTQNNSKQTGVLIESAASLNVDYSFLNSTIIFESVFSKAGAAPWNLSRSTSWFSQTTPFQPVYADNYNNIQNWVGNSDFAFSLKYLYHLDNISPFLSFKVLGDNFIYRERDSAHLLRTADDSKSHGGLTKIGSGVEIKKGDFKIIPEFEYLNAKNAVFTSSSNIRSNRLLSTFKKKDYVVSLTVEYEFDGDVK